MIAARCSYCGSIGCTFCEEYFREAFKKLGMETKYQVGRIYIVNQLGQSPQKVLIVEKTEKTYLVKFLDSVNQPTVRYLIENFENDYSLLETLPSVVEQFEKLKERNPELLPGHIFQPIGGLGKVPYHTICSCNPVNGGSGICGCVIGNQWVYPSDSKVFTTEYFLRSENIESKSSSNQEEKEKK